MIGNLIGGITGAASGILGALGGQGPSGMGAKNINAGAFKDPNLDKNKQLLEQQRQMQLQQAQAGQQAQTGVQQNQLQLINQLQGRVAGAAPSVAELQMQKAAEDQRKALASQAASLPSGQAGLAQRNVARAQAQAGQQLVADTGLLRAQEQMAAEQNLAGLLAQTRNQDIGSQQGADQLALQYMQLGLGVDQAQFLANQELERLRQGARAQQAQVGAQQQAGMLGALGTVGAALLSDERQKTDVKDSGKDVDKFLSALAAKNYKYKDASLPGAAEGKRYGIIAQDLEKSDMGKSLVKDTAQGKMIDTNQAVGALLASVSHLNKRIKDLEA